MHGRTKVGNEGQGCVRGKRQETGLGVHEGKKGGKWDQGCVRGKMAGNEVGGA